MPPWLHVCSVVSDSWDPMDGSPPASSVHEISQARTLKQVATYSSRGSAWSRNRTCVSCVSCIGRRILYHWTTWEGPRERRARTLKQQAAMLLQQTFTHKHRNIHIYKFHLYKILKNANYSDRNLRSVVDWRWGGRWRDYKGYENLVRWWKCLLSWWWWWFLYICQDCSNFILGLVQFILHRLYLNKAIKKKKNKTPIEQITSCPKLAFPFRAYTPGASRRRCLARPGAHLWDLSCWREPRRERDLYSHGHFDLSTL